MAYLISRLKTKIQNTMILLVIIPMWMNFLLRTYAWLSILSKNGLINSFLSIIGIQPLDLLYTEGAVMIGMVYNFLPFIDVYKRQYNRRRQMDIGERLKQHRLQLGLTQEELAERSELTKGFISQVERDLTSPSVASLEDILEALGTNLGDFFNEEKQMCIRDRN